MTTKGKAYAVEEAVAIHLLPYKELLTTVVLHLMKQLQLHLISVFTAAAILGIWINLLALSAIVTKSANVPINVKH